MPFSDPLADGPVIHAAGTAALRQGATLAGVLEVARDLAPQVPVVLMCYANLIVVRGLQRFADALVQARVSGLIVPDLPLRGGRRDPGGVHGPWAGAGAAGGADHAPTSAWRGSAPRRRGSSTRCR